MDFKTGMWNEKIDVRDFIHQNYTEYLGNEDFLVKPTVKTLNLMKKVEKLLSEELSKGVLDIETGIFSGIDNFMAGYIDKENEVIFGLQTDAPLKRIINPYGGYRMD